MSWPYKKADVLTKGEGSCRGCPSPATFSKQEGLAMASGVVRISQGYLAAISCAACAIAVYTHSTMVLSPRFHGYGD